MSPDHPQLTRQYLTYAEMRQQTLKTGCLDLSRTKFLYPTTLLPLLLSIRKDLWRLKYVPPADPDVRSYIDLMGQNKGLDSLNRQTYLPLVALPRSEKESQPILNKVYELGGDVGGKNAFRLLVGELVDNIYQHSMFESALVMAQQYRKLNELHLCIIDDGITIGGSLNRAGLVLDDYQAIVDALQGASSKENVERGRGLGASVGLMTKGYGGRMLVVSGKGGIHLGNGAPVGYRLSETFKYEGPLISMAIPLVKTEVDPYEYVEM